MEGHLRLVQTGYEERLDRLGQAMDAAMGGAKLSAAANEDAIIAALPRIAVSAERQDMPTYTALMAEVCSSHGRRVGCSLLNASWKIFASLNIAPLRRCAR